MKGNFHMTRSLYMLNAKRTEPVRTALNSPTPALLQTHRVASGWTRLCFAPQSRGSPDLRNVFAEANSQDAECNRSWWVYGAAGRMYHSDGRAAPAGSHIGAINMSHLNKMRGVEYSMHLFKFTRLFCFVNAPQKLAICSQPEPHQSSWIISFTRLKVIIAVSNEFLNQNW